MFSGWGVSYIDLTADLPTSSLPSHVNLKCCPNPGDPTLPSLLSCGVSQVKQRGVPTNPTSWNTFCETFLSQMLIRISRQNHPDYGFLRENIFSYWLQGSEVHELLGRFISSCVSFDKQQSWGVCAFYLGFLIGWCSLGVRGFCILPLFPIVIYQHWHPFPRWPSPPSILPFYCYFHGTFALWIFPPVGFYLAYSLLFISRSF